MDRIVQIRVTIPESMNSEIHKVIEESIDWATLTMIDRLRRVLPHSVKVEDASLSPVKPEK